MARRARILARQGAPPALLALALALAGCARPGAKAAGVVTLDFWALGTEGEVVQPLVREFERENPEIRVRLQRIPFSAAHEKLLTAFVGDATPDVAQIGNTWVAEFAALGGLAPLDARIAGSAVIDSAGFFGGIWRTNEIGGVVYGVPWYVDTRLVFYRTDLLARAGFDAFPTSWDGWVESMRRLKAQLGPGAYPIFLPTDEWTQPVVLAQQLGSPILKDGGRYGAFLDPAFRRAFSFYVDLFRRGYAPAIANAEMSNIYQEFARGRFAMYITGPWNIGEFRRRLPDSLRDAWATAPLPAPAGSEPPGVSTAGGSSLVVFRASPQADAAWRLIEFLSRPRSQLAFYGLSGDLPARIEAWRTPLAAGAPGSAVAAGPRAAADSGRAGVRSLVEDRYARAFWEQLQRVEPLPKVPEMELIAQLVGQHAEAAIRGGAAVPDALASLQKDVDAALAKRRWMLARGR